jgi:hypothetical protein
MTTATGALILKYGIVDKRQDDFMHWHTHSHIPSRLALPGFKQIRRWESMQNQNEFLCIYDLEYPQALQSVSYQELMQAQPSKEEIDLEDAFLLHWRAECKKISTVGGENNSLLVLYEAEKSVADSLSVNDDSMKYKISITHYKVENLIGSNSISDLNELIIFQSSGTPENLVQSLQQIDGIKKQRAAQVFRLDLLTKN